MDSKEELNTFTITNIYYERIIRGLEIYFTRFVKKVHKLNSHCYDGDNDRYTIINSDNFKIDIKLTFECDNEDHIEMNDIEDIDSKQCHNKYIIYIDYISKYTDSEITLLYEEVEVYDHDNLIDTTFMKKYFNDNLQLNGKQFIFCKICHNSIAKEEHDNKCDICYIYSYKREENCCVCLENERRWIKLLPCNHILHMRCWFRIKNNKCPLCRCEKVESIIDYIE